MVIVINRGGVVKVACGDSTATTNCYAGGHNKQGQWDVVFS